MRYLVGLVLYVIAMPGFSAPCSTVQDPLERLACYDRMETCRAIADSSDRLACFDGVYVEDIAPVDVPGNDFGADKPDSENVEHDGISETTLPVVQRPEPKPKTSQKTATEQTTLQQTTSQQTAPQQITPQQTVQQTTPEQVDDNKSFPIKALNRMFSRESGSDAKKQKSPKPEKPKIDSSIEKVEHNHLQVAYLTFANGQVWKEINRSGFRYRVGTQATISKGVFGSSNLYVEGMSKHVKVTRIK